MQLEINEIRNLLALISRPETTVKANEVQVVAQLQLKLTGMLPKEEPKEETK